MLTQTQSVIDIIKIQTKMLNNKNRKPPNKEVYKALKILTLQLINLEIGTLKKF